jgi:hypothetical protein
VKRDYLKAGAMVAALVTMAPAEYTLGQACGFGHLAAGLPASLDIYTLRAIRTGRDVPVVALVMIAVNAAAHLIAARHLAVTWYLIVAVSALPVLVLVRVERLGKVPGGNVSAETEPEVAQSDRLPEPVAVPAEPAAEPAAEPVTLERVDEASSSGHLEGGAPTFGPLVPVAELLAGTSPDQGGALAGVLDGTPAEPAPATAEPVEPEPEPIGVPPGVSVEHVTLAQLWLKTDPKLTGTAIGTRLGTSDSYGRRVKRVALELAGASS